MTPKDLRQGGTNGAGKKGKPKSKGGVLVIRQRRDGSGTFISCSRYPKCKFIKKMKQKKPKKELALFVLYVKRAILVNDVDDLEFFILVQIIPIVNSPSKPNPAWPAGTGKICEKCASLMMQGTKTIGERCSNNKCPNYRPDKLNKKIISIE